MIGDVDELGICKLSQQLGGREELEYQVGKHGRKELRTRLSSCVIVTIATCGEIDGLSGPVLRDMDGVINTSSTGRQTYDDLYGAGADVDDLVIRCDIISPPVRCPVEVGGNFVVIQKHGGEVEISLRVPRRSSRSCGTRAGGGAQSRSGGTGRARSRGG